MAPTTAARTSDLTIDALRQMGELRAHPDALAARAAVETATARHDTLARERAEAQQLVRSAPTGLAQRDAKRAFDAKRDECDRALHEKQQADAALRATERRAHEAAAPVIKAAFLASGDDSEPDVRAALARLEAVRDVLRVNEAWAWRSGGSYGPPKRAVHDSYDVACARVQGALEHWLKVLGDARR
jgi:hypothetical protein